MSRINTAGYVSRRVCKGTESDVYVVKDYRMSLLQIYIPKHLVGRRIKFKVVLLDEGVDYASKSYKKISGHSKPPKGGI